MRAAIAYFFCATVLISCNELQKKIFGIKGTAYVANLKILPQAETKFTTQTSILRKRVMSAYVADGESVSEGGAYSIQVNGVGDSNCLKTLLLTRGQLAIYHTFEYSELMGYIDAIQQLSLKKSNEQKPVFAPTENGLLTEEEILYKLSKENVSDIIANSLFAYLSPPFMPNGLVEEGAICGYALGKDTANVVRILNTYSLPVNLPLTLRWYWGVFSSSADSIFVLYAIKSDTVLPAPILTNKHVIESWADEQTEDGRALYSVILRLNGVGSSAFHKATLEAANAVVNGQSTHKSLAIVLDNKVYSCPRVMQEITGGRLSITGMSSYEEAKVLSIIVANEPLSTQVNLLSIHKK